ncbi:MAG: dienelactone hydrolase family protein [Sphingomicrobium sp.]
MDPTTRRSAITLYDRFTHGLIERREFMARMVRLTGSAAAANLLIGTIAARADAKPLVDPADKRLTISSHEVAGTKTYVAELRNHSLKPTVVVVHENRGLNEHTRDVARRLAIAGFRAVAVDFLSKMGGTPTDEDKAREMIGKLDLAQASADGVAIIQALKGSSRGGKVGVVGFCWGGGMVNRLAVAAGDALDACVVYYGPAPVPAEAVTVAAPLTIHLAGLDTRIAETEFPWITALRAAGKTVAYFDYPEVNHAFNNDTSAERYNAAAASLAWGRTLRFFRRTLR